MKPERFIRRYETALATQEWGQVAPLIHDDVCVTFSTGAVYKGKAAVKEAFERNFSQIEDETYVISNVHWVKTTEEVAVYLFDFTWTGLINDQQATGSGRGTSVLILDDGKWLLLAEHLGPGSRGNDGRTEET